MISTQVQSAVRTLQYQSLATVDGYQLDVTDRALDELLRHPSSEQPAAFQLRSARANAAKVVGSRRVILDREVLRNRNSRPGVNRPARLVHLPDSGTTEIYDWLATTPRLNSGQRRVLTDLANGHDAHSLAQRDRLPLRRVQERISRARQAGWNAYQLEVLTP